MDKEIIQSFLIETFSNGNDFDVQKISYFITLDNDQRNSQIKDWAINKMIFLNNRKANLDNIKQASEQAIDAEIVKLQTVI